MFRLLVLGEGSHAVPDRQDFDDKLPAITAAKQYIEKYPQIAVIVTQDVAKVEMAAVVDELLPMALLPKLMYRGPGPEVTAEEAYTGPPRAAQSKPRLLIVQGRKATGAEIVGHLMVVAEGRIVKNAFGDLQLTDMPLVGEEIGLVNNALQGR